MSSSPAEITLELRPSARYDVIDVRRKIAERFGDLLAHYRKSAYCSYHTTAGYLEQSLCARLYRRDCLEPFVQVFCQLFPPDANYQHDRLELRRELSPEQRRREPKNADSHLAFIGAGLKNCVTYVNRPDTPAYFIDLDGVHEHGRRCRHTTVLAFDREETVAAQRFVVPVSAHPVDSINLRDPRIGLFEELCEMVRTHGIEKGRIDIALATEERHTGLTVNEYETLLMQHDLAEVLGDPLRYMAQRGRHIFTDPRAIPGKTLNYAQYDLVRVLNELLDAFGVSESLLERALAKLIGVPASRFLRMKRSVSLLVSDGDGEGPGTIVQGTYQSPILVQWRKAAARSRQLEVTLTRFE